MRNRAAFQTRLASIMEALAKAAETEITKLVEDGSVELRLEVSRSHKEIDWLRRKLQQVESELRTAKDAATLEIRSVGVQVVDQCDAIGGTVEVDTDAPFIEKFNKKNCGAQTCDTRPDFGSVVKEEQEEEHVAVIVQTESEDSAGRLNNVGPENEMFESDHLTYRCFTLGDSNMTDDPDCANATEQFAQRLSILSSKQRAKATLVEPGSALSSLENDDHAADGGVVKEEAGAQCSYPEESSIEMGDAQQTELDQPSLSTNDDLTAEQFCRIKVVSDYSTGPVSSSDQNAEIPWKPGEKEKRHSCPQCQKRFDHARDLKRHLRRHTGEKPFSCAQCGKRFSLKCSLNRHERIHTGNKPFSCVYCEKRFAQGSHLREHYRVHTGERPYHCTLCGKSFTQSSGLKNHQKTHCRN